MCSYAILPALVTPYFGFLPIFQAFLRLLRLLWAAVPDFYLIFFSSAFIAFRLGSLLI
jgi:hypothetical protein